MRGAAFEIWRYAFDFIRNWSHMRSARMWKRKRKHTRHTPLSGHSSQPWPALQQMPHLPANSVAGREMPALAPAHVRGENMQGTAMYAIQRKCQKAKRSKKKQKKWKLHVLLAPQVHTFLLETKITSAGEIFHFCRIFHKKGGANLQNNKVDSLTFHYATP